MDNHDFKNRIHKDEAFCNKAMSLIGTNSAYYLEKWKSHSSPKKFSGINWAALFLGPFWLAYRKMYGMVIAYFLLIFIGIGLTSLVVPLMDVNLMTTFRIVVIIFIGVFFGIKGNAFYSSHISRLASEEESPSKPIAPLFKGVGTSLLGAILAPVILTALLFLPFQWIDSLANTLPEGAYVYEATQVPPASLNDVKSNSEGYIEFEKYESNVQLLYYSKEPVGDQNVEVKLEYREDDSQDWEEISRRSYVYFTSNHVNLQLVNAELASTPTGLYKATVLIDGEVKGTTLFEIIMQRD